MKSCNEQSFASPDEDQLGEKEYEQDKNFYF